MPLDPRMGQPALLGCLDRSDRGAPGSVKIQRVTVARDGSEYVVHAVFPGEQGTPRTLYTSLVLQER